MFLINHKATWHIVQFKAFIPANWWLNCSSIMRRSDSFLLCCMWTLSAFIPLSPAAHTDAFMSLCSSQFSSSTQEGRRWKHSCFVLQSQSVVVVHVIGGVSCASVFALFLQQKHLFFYYSLFLLQSKPHSPTPFIYFLFVNIFSLLSSPQIPPSLHFPVHLDNSFWILLRNKIQQNRPDDSSSLMWDKHHRHTFGVSSCALSSPWGSWSCDRSIAAETKEKHFSKVGFNTM